MPRKTFTVELYKGADADKNYKRLSGAHVEAGEIFVEGYQDGNHQQLTPAFTMQKSSMIVPGRPIDFDISSVDFYSVYNCNYLAVYDENKTDVWFGFIDSIEYLNDGTARVSWSVDFWATYRNKIHLAQKQFVQRALYMPKDFMLDSRRTVDSSLPNDEKNKLQKSSEIKFDNKKSDDVWYLFYLMPRLGSEEHASNLSTEEFGFPEIEEKEYGRIAGADQLNQYQWLDKNYQPKDKDLTNKVDWNKWDSKFKIFGDDFAENKISIQAYAPEIYATKRLEDAYKIDFIGGEGFRIVGCEIRKNIDIDQFEKIGGSLSGDSPIYHYNQGFDDFDSMIYEHDNLSEQGNFSYENIYNANSYREEISIGDKKIKVNPALHMTGEIGWHTWDSIIPGFKPFYSFYKVNGMIAPVSPWQADETTPAVLADADRSVPIYADQTMAYYLSHQNRINSELQKQLITAKANVANSKKALENALQKIASEYDVSIVNLENALYNSTRTNKFTNSVDKDQLAYGYTQNSNNLAANNALSKSNLEANQKVSLINTENSQETAVKNLKASNTTASENLGTSNGAAINNLANSNQTTLSNMKRSNDTAINNMTSAQQTAHSNLTSSQSTAEKNLENSNKTAQANLKTGNDNQVDINKSNTKTQKDNLDLGTALTKSNADKTTANANQNLQLQKAESFVTGLNLTAGIAKFLTGALFSAATGFLDYNTGVEVNGNNNQLTKNLADDSNATSKKQMDNSLTLALSNLQKNYDTSLAQMKASQATAISNLEASNTTAQSNLHDTQTNALANLKASQATALSNANDSMSTAKSNLATSQSAAESNLANSQANALANLTRSNELALSNLQNTFKTQKENFDRDYQKATNSLKNGNTISNKSLENALKKALQVLNYGNDLSKVNLNNSTLKAYTFAFMDADLAQRQEAQTMVANVEGMLNSMNAQYIDWSQKGNSVKAVDGQAAITQIFKKLTPYDNIFSVQDHTKRQIADYIHTNGSLVNRKIGLDQITNVSDHTDYLGNKIEGNVPQFVKTENCKLQGSVPQEALTILQSAFDNGVYIEPNSIGSEESYPLQKDEALSDYNKSQAATIEIGNN